MLKYRSLHLLLGIVGLAPGASLADPAMGQHQVGPWRTTVMRAAVSPRTPLDRGSAGSHRLEGIASYYWQGQRTASGEPFDRTALTAAHPTLPFNSLVRVTNRASGSSVVVRINDRGPFTPGRVIDLSETAAEMIDLKARGVAPVQIEVLALPSGSKSR
jgi:rare lipoprotein A